MIRYAIALFLFSLLAGCYRQGDGVAIPFDHPANPYAQGAPPIEVPAIQGRAEEVKPELGKEAPASTQQPQAPSSGGADAHQHHH